MNIDVCEPIFNFMQHPNPNLGKFYNLFKNIIPPKGHLQWSVQKLQYQASLYHNRKLKTTLSISSLI